MVWISALHSMWLLQVWTGRAGGNYRHSVSHLPEELRLQNGPALLALDWAQRGSKQERHTTEGTRTRRFNPLSHVHMCRMMIVNNAWVYKEIKAVSEANEKKEEKLQADIKPVSYKQKSHIWKTGGKKSRTHKFMHPPTTLHVTLVP